MSPYFHFIYLSVHDPSPPNLRYIFWLSRNFQMTVIYGVGLFHFPKKLNAFPCKILYILNIHVVLPKPVISICWYTCFFTITKIRLISKTILPVLSHIIINIFWLEIETQHCITKFVAKHGWFIITKYVKWYLIA